MSGKKISDEEIGKELEDRLDDDDQDILDDDDYTVKVHREDYTVKRRFFDKGKALEAADSLRMDKRNIVEDNIEHDFVTLIDEEDDVDWDNLVDSGLKFYPPISDAAERKLEDTSNVAEELAAERAMVGNELDKTMTMGSRGKIDYPKIEPKKDDETIAEEVPGDIEVDVPGIDEEDIDFDFDKKSGAEENDTEDDIDINDDEDFDDVFEGEDEFSEPEKVRHAKSGLPVAKIGVVVLVVVACIGLVLYFSRTPASVDPMPPVTDTKSVKTHKVVKTVNPPAEKTAGEIPKTVEETKQAENTLAVNEPEQVDAMETEPETMGMPLPEVTIFHPYTLHISSYKSQAKADSEVRRIRKKGYNAYSAFINIPGKGVWHRIYAGYYDNFKKATQEVVLLKKKLREDAIVAKTIFAIQIGEIALKEDLSDLQNRLQDKGYSVYYIPVTDDEQYVRLLAGAYRKEVGAKGLYTNLSEDGFDVKIVKR